MSGLKQINISYNKVEDRLLLQITNLDDEEIRLWLTYHFTSKILEALNASLTRKDIPKMGVQTARQVLQADKAVASEKAVTHTNFRSKSETLPFGKDGKLVTSINVTPGTDFYSLTFGGVDKQSVTIKLPREILLTVIDSIEKKASEAEWLFKNNPTPLPTASLSMSRH